MSLPHSIAFQRVVSLSGLLAADGLTVSHIQSACLPAMNPWSLDHFFIDGPHQRWGSYPQPVTHLPPSITSPSINSEDSIIGRRQASDIRFRFEIGQINDQCPVTSQQARLLFFLWRSMGNHAVIGGIDVAPPLHHISTHGLA